MYKYTTCNSLHKYTIILQNIFIVSIYSEIELKIIRVNQIKLRNKKNENIVIIDLQEIIAIFITSVIITIIILYIVMNIDKFTTT
jgi:hypothetical protein